MTPRRSDRDADLDATANVLGALAMAITDRISNSVAAAAGQSVSAAAALSALHHFPEPPNLDRLGQVLGLTHSGVVRLVDRLAGAGLVVRNPGADGRTRVLALTPAGLAVAERVTAARADALAGLLADLAPDQRRALHGLVSSLMAALVRTKESGAWTCRLCDLRACGRPAGRCPAANAAAARFGPPPGPA
jgi:DNA-binding MarR family transcriptional regulator